MRETDFLDGKQLNLASKLDNADKRFTQFSANACFEDSQVDDAKSCAVEATM